MPVFQVPELSPSYCTPAQPKANALRYNGGWISLSLLALFELGTSLVTIQFLSMMVCIYDNPITEGVLALTVAKFRTRSPLSHVNAAEHVLTIVVGFGLKKNSVLYVFYRDGKSRHRVPRRTRLMIIYRIHIFPGFVW